MNAEARFVESIEAAAFADLYAAAPAALGLTSMQRNATTILIARSIAAPYFNRAIGVGVEQPATEADLDAIDTAYREAGVKTWWVHLAPQAAPAALLQWLQARGYSLPPRKSWAKMLRGTEPPPEVSTSLVVRRAQPEEAQAVGETVCEAYGMPTELGPWFAAAARLPRWRGYVALDASRVLGAGLLYIDGRDAWLGAGGVRAKARGQHAHRALMALRIREAIAAGCTRIATETGEPVGDEPNPSLANMGFCGFRKVCSRLNYAFSA